MVQALALRASTRDTAGTYIVHSSVRKTHFKQMPTNVIKVSSVQGMGTHSMET
jgi:hypothetical protein